MDEVSIGVAVTDAAGGIARGQAKIQIAQIWDVPSAIDPTGKDFVDADLLAFIRSVPDGPSPELPSVVRFPKDARYRISNSLEMARRANLLFATPRTTIDATALVTGKQPTWSVLFSKHVGFEGRFIVEGGNPDPSRYTGEPLEYSHGWHFWGSHYVGIEGCEVYNVFGDGVTFSGRWDRGTPYGSSNGHAKGCIFDGGGRMGVAITTGRGYLIENNNLRNFPWIFDLESEWDSVGFDTGDVTIRGNRTGFYRLVWFANAGGKLPQKDVTVEDNVMEDIAVPTTWAPVSMLPPTAPREHYIIRRNIFRMGGGINWGPYAVRIAKAGARDVEIEGNTAIFRRASPDNALAGLLNAHDVRITKNDSFGASKLVNDFGNSDWTAEENTCDGAPCK